MATQEQYDAIKEAFTTYEERKTQYRKELIHNLRTAELTDAQLDRLEDLILKN